MKIYNGFVLAGIVLAGCLAAGSADAQSQRVRVTVQNTAASGGTFLTPVFVGFDNGSFDLFDVGGMASPGLELVAELGDTSLLTTEFSAGSGPRFSGTLASPVGMPILAPGESVSQDFTIDLAGSTNLTLATMLLPTSDFFLGTSSSLNLGNLRSTPFSMLLSNIYDAGTEANAFATSPATGLFPGLPPGDPLLSPNDPNNLIRLVGSDPFADFSDLPAGGFNPPLSGLLVTVTAVPEPSSMAAIGVIAIGGYFVRRRRAKSATKIAA